VTRGLPMAIRVIVTALALCALYPEARAACTCDCNGGRWLAKCDAGDDDSLAKRCVMECARRSGSGGPRPSGSVTVSIIRSMDFGTPYLTCTSINGVSESPQSCQTRSYRKGEWNSCQRDAEAFMAKNNNVEATCHITEDFPHARARVR
jgi:hypothetical protein